MGFDSPSFEGKDYKEQVCHEDAHFVREEAKKRECELALREQVGAVSGAVAGAMLRDSSSSNVVLEMIGISYFVCMGRVEHTLRSVEGVNSAVVTLDTNRAMVNLDPTFVSKQKDLDPPLKPECISLFKPAIPSSNLDNNKPKATSSSSTTAATVTPTSNGILQQVSKNAAKSFAEIKVMYDVRAPGLADFQRDVCKTGCEHGLLCG